jgi:hypothetical protein
MTPEPTARWWKYVRAGRIFCGPVPGGHHIPNTFKVNESGFVRCDHWMKNEKRECGNWVFLYAIRGGGIVIARVSLEEQRDMDSLSTPDEMITYLGIFP